MLTLITWLLECLSGFLPAFYSLKTFGILLYGKFISSSFFDLCIYLYQYELVAIYFIPWHDYNQYKENIFLRVLILALVIGSSSSWCIRFFRKIQKSRLFL